MRRGFAIGALAMTLGAAMIMASGVADQAGPVAAGVPTFTRDVAPILYKNCTGCHRPGEIAPMSLLTYEDARSTRSRCAGRQAP